MPPFVGRTAELAQIAEVLASAGDGPAAVVVVGEPGSGKSRLLAEAVPAIDARALRIVGYEPEMSIPLAAASELLAGLVLDGEQTARLEPLRVFESVHRSLGSIAPVLLVIDDLHWLDELSLALYHYLIRAAATGRRRLLLLVGARPSQQADALARSFSQILPPERVAVIELGPLSFEEAGELALQLAPALGEQSRRELLTRAAGSPFWLEALAQTGGAVAGVRQLVTARLRGAQADAVELLALLVVTARPLALADVARLADWSSERAEHAAAELVARGVGLYVAGGIRLAHDLIREAALEEIPDERRRDVHRRVAEWLEDVAGEDLRALREALHHRHAAALPSLALAIRLARSQQRTLLGEEGLSLLARIADSGAGDTAAVVELNREVASLASELAQYDVALERWQFVAEHAREQEKRAAAFVRAARASLALNGAVEARRALDRARAEDVRDEFFQLELDSQAATVGLWSGDDRAPARAFARAVVDRAHRLYASTDRDHLDARKRRAYLEALRVEYDLAYQEDDVETLLASSKRRAAVARSFDLEAFLAATIAEGRALRRMCRLGEAEQRLRSALDEAHRAVLPQLTIDAAYWLASALELTGRVAEAEQIATEAVELGARAGDEALGRHSIERLTYKLSLHRGDWAPALEGMRAYAQEASAHARIELYGDGALWLALVGGRELESESLMWLADARACAEQAACPRCSTELRLVAAEVLARSGRAAEATTQLTEWQALQRKPEPRDEVARQRVEALATDNGSAAARLEATVRLAARSGLVLEALWTQLDLARALAATERARAIEISRDVAAAAADLGALTEQQVAEQLLRSLGVRTWRRRGLAGEPLTKREREIAQLVAAGASNPEIGRRLFLSRKTVERHVSNIFKKLGVRNRAELAAKATELKLEGAPR